MSPPRLRIAILPDARGLEIARARDALYAWLLARSRRGTLVLRSDAAAPEGGEIERGVIDDLAWLGLGWDEGIDAEGESGPYRRSQRGHLYRDIAVDLLRRGQAYRCRCQRPAGKGENGSPTRCPCRDGAPAADLASDRVAAGATILLEAAPAGEDGGVVFVDAVRGKMKRSIGETGDLVLLHGDGRPGREFADACDDAMMKITHVVSTSNRLRETSRQALAHAAIGIGKVPLFIHLPPIGGADNPDAPEEGSASTIGDLRLAGYPPEAVLDLLAQLGGATNGRQSLLTREEMLAGFDLERTAADPQSFEPRQLAALSCRHVARMNPERLAELAAGHLAEAGLLRNPPSSEECAWAGAVARLYAGRLARMSDLADRAELFFRFDPGRGPFGETVRLASRRPAWRRVIATLVETLEARPHGEELTVARFQALVAAVRRTTGIKGRELYDALRLALSGRPDGPDLAQLIVLIERGSRLSLPQPVVGCVERARRLLAMTRPGSP